MPLTPTSLILISTVIIDNDKSHCKGIRDAERYAKLLGLACLIGAMGLLPSSQSRAAGWLKDETTGTT